MRKLRTLAEMLAKDPRLTDYDFWRAVRALDDEIYRAAREKQPIPIGMLYTRKALVAARARRGGG